VVGGEVEVGVGVEVEVGVVVVVGVVVEVEIARLSRKEKVMRKIVEQVEGEGLQSLLGENVVLWCANYIYAGKLAGVNDSDVLLHDASVVYETGELCASAWKDAQKLPGPWYVRTASIESYGKSGK